MQRKKECLYVRQRDRKELDCMKKEKKKEKKKEEEEGIRLYEA